MNNIVTRMVVLDNLERIMGYLPKGYKAPKGNFEAGALDKDGVRHVSGIYHVAKRKINLEHIMEYDINLIAR